MCSRVLAKECYSFQHIHGDGYEGAQHQNSIFKKVTRFASKMVLRSLAVRVKEKLKYTVSFT